MKSGGARSGGRFVISYSASRLKGKPGPETARAITCFQGMEESVNRPRPGFDSLPRGPIIFASRGCAAAAAKKARREIFRRIRQGKAGY